MPTRPDSYRAAQLPLFTIFEPKMKSGKTTGRIAIVSASEEESGFAGLTNCGFKRKRIAGYDFYEGEIQGAPVVLLITGWGKVRAAQSVTLLHHHYPVTRLFFVGACGGIGEWQRGDICIPALFDYYDFNVFPLLKSHIYPQFEPHGYLALKHNAGMIKLVERLLAEFGRVFYGLALTGDSFVTDKEVIHRTGKLDKFYKKLLPEMMKRGREASGGSLNLPALLKKSPKGAIIDMESAVIAETCVNLNIDFLVIRIVSDSIDSNSHNDFTAFLTETMPRMTDKIIQIICK